MRTRAQAAEELRIFDLKAKWEQTTDGKIKATSIKRRVNELLQERKVRLRERQLKLRSLLEEEERQYVAEVEAMVETPLEREAKMRDRLRQLKEVREAERATQAEEKLEQHFLQNCEQLRTLRSKQDAQTMHQHRHVQVRERQAIVEREKDVDRLYADLWDQDRQAKDRRAAEEESARRARNAEQSAVLAKQLAAIEENRLWQARLRQEEEQMRLEEAQATADEDRREKQVRAEAARKQMRQMQRYNRALQREQQQRQAEEQALDARILMAALDAHEQEHNDVAQKKATWINEARVYLQFLADQKAAQGQAQLELDALHEAEAEKMWQRRAQKWEAERLARSALMGEVLETRKLQVAAKIEALHWEQQQAHEEAVVLKESVAEHERTEAEKARRVQSARAGHAKDLELQIVANAEQRAIQRREELEHNDRLHRTQALVDEKTQRALSGLSIRGAAL